MSFRDMFQEIIPSASDVPAEIIDMGRNRFIGIITASVDEDLAGLDRAGFMAPDIPNVESIVQEPKTPEPTAQSAQVIDLASRQQTPAEEMAQQAREQIERLSA